ncbi:MAG: hypothetical protein Phyf2KO_02100 [Phycisphaerales bacterium]
MLLYGVLLSSLVLSGEATDKQDWGTPELVGAGSVSTTGTEFNTTFSPDGDVLILTRYDNATGVGSIEALTQTDGVWSKVDYFDGRLDGVDAGDGHVAPDGSKFVFYRDADIWELSRDEVRQWSEPSRVGESISTSSPEAYPTLSAQGELCFTRQDRGNWDVYLAKSEGESWGQPERLGAPVNTPYREHDALITPDGNRLIFVRMGETGGPGMSDLYTCVRTASGWSEPKLLPFNSPEIDGSPCLSPDGKWLYFTSGRPTGTDKASGLCIWRVRTPRNASETGWR